MRFAGHRSSSKLICGGVLLTPTLLVALLLLSLGCTSHTQRISKVRSDFFSGDLQAADEESTALLAKKKLRDKNLVKLDQALVKLSQGRAGDCENLFREVRDEFSSGKPLDNLKDLTAWAIDEQHRAYHPDDYERLSIQVFLAISNLLQGGDDAIAYSHQITAMQSDIENRIRTISQPPENQTANNSENANQPVSTSNQGPDLASDEPVVPESKAQSFQQIALAPYIVALLHEQTHSDYDSAARFYQRTIEFNPEFEEARSALQRSLNGTHSRKGNGVLYVFAAVGKGPFKVGGHR